MEEYKVSYCYTTPKGIVITGKCILQAKSIMGAYSSLKKLILSRNVSVVEILECKKWTKQ